MKGTILWITLLLGALLVPATASADVAPRPIRNPRVEKCTIEKQAKKCNCACKACVGYDKDKRATCRGECKKEGYTFACRTYGNYREVWCNGAKKKKGKKDEASSQTHTTPALAGAASVAVICGIMFLGLRRRRKDDESDS